MKIITKKELPFKVERKKVNEILTLLFNVKQEELKKALEETCSVDSPITFMQHHGGIYSTYYFGTKWGTVKAYIGDLPEDSEVIFLKDVTLGLINKTKVNCKAKYRANDEPSLEICSCHNFCKHDNMQFDTSLG